ncbi:MAG TPA: hypothetical protein VGF92_15660 [Stellaceae bacterium]|jgi:hypothetical protein
MPVGQDVAKARIKEIDNDAGKWGAIVFFVCVPVFLFAGGLSWWAVFWAFAIGAGVMSTRRKHLMDKERELAAVRVAREPAGFK